MDAASDDSTAPTSGRPLFGTGANQSGIADHNARLVLTAVQGAARPAAEIARATGLTAQTVSVIVRRLEAEGLVMRLDAQKGRAGRPRVPVALAPGGALAFGLKVGRRSADLLLVDLSGRVWGRRRLRYDYPLPDPVLSFLADGLWRLTSGARRGGLDPARICGLGIAVPGEMWNWGEAVGAPEDLMARWRELDLAEEAQRLSGLPVHVRNDATSAARAEHRLGTSHGFRDWVHLFVGALIGGGLILDGRVRDGVKGNAGAFGPMGVCGPSGRMHLMDRASLYLLEAEHGAPLPLPEDDWSGLGAPLGRWLDTAAGALAEAVLNTASVIDVEGVVIDGGFPADVRAKLVARVNGALRGFDGRGLLMPQVLAGSVGPDARALGGAFGPLGERFLLD